MKRNLSIEMFKGKLRGYIFFKKQIEKYKEEIEYCYDKLGASPKSPNLQSEPIHSVKDIDKEHETRDKITALELKLSHAESEIQFIDEILDKIENPLRGAIINVYCYRKTIYSQARKLYMAKTTLQDKIDKEIDRAIRETL